MYAWTVDNSMCIYEIISISIEKEKYKITGIIMYYPVSFLLQIKYVIPYVALFFTKTQLWRELHMHCYLIYFTIPETRCLSRGEMLTMFRVEVYLALTRNLTFQETDCRRRAVCPISRRRVRYAARFYANREISEDTWSFCTLVWVIAASPAYTRGIGDRRRTGPMISVCHRWHAFVPPPG